MAMCLLSTGMARAQGATLGIRVAAGPLAQGSPITTETGGATVVGLDATLRHRFALSVGTELSQARVRSDVTVCYSVSPAGECFHRPHDERVRALFVDLRWQRDERRTVIPYVSVGAAWQRSAAESNAGERGSWISPQADVGLEVGSRTVAVVVDARLRELQRWPRLQTDGQGALLVGLRWRFKRAAA
ncbi:MAG: hypothetical protein U0132_16955 [Gemmatimonadaceae bacterium]